MSADVKADKLDEWEREAQEFLTGTKLHTEERCGLANRRVLKLIAALRKYREARERNRYNPGSSRVTNLMAEAEAILEGEGKSDADR